MLIGTGTASASRAPASSSKSTLTICEDAELSGAFGVLGEATPEGGRAEVDHLNATGGILGHKVKLVVLNNQSTPTLAAEIVRECVEKYHAWAVIGDVSSDDLVPSIPVANELHVPFISWSSGWNFPGLPSSDYRDWAFPGNANAFLDDDLEAINDIALPRHYTRLALMYVDDSAGVANLPAMKSYAKKYHFKLVANQVMEPGQTDVTPEVVKLLQAKPQLIVLGIAPGTDSVTFLKAVRAENATIPIAVCAACAIGSFISAMGGAKDMADIYSTGTARQLVASLTPSSPDYKETVTDVDNYYHWMDKEGYTGPSLINSGTGAWDTIEILAEAAAAAHSVSLDAVKKALEHQKVDTLGILWDRTPTNYAGATALGAVVAINANGTQTVLKSHDYSS